MNKQDCLYATEKIIDAIEPRPCLYDPDNEKFSEKAYKLTQWREVCKEVYPQWDELCLQERCEFLHAIQSRWKNLRTCYGREIKARRKDEKKGIKRRKPYAHYHRLHFLENKINVKYTGSDDDDEDSRPKKVKSEISGDYDGNDDEDDEGEEEYVHISAADDDDQSDVKNDYVSVSRAGINIEKDFDTPISLEPATTENNLLLRFIKHLKKEDQDEDRHFLLSLLPTFKQMSNKAKIEARIEILKVMQGICYKNS